MEPATQELRVALEYLKQASDALSQIRLAGNNQVDRQQRIIELIKLIDQLGDSLKFGTVTTEVLKKLDYTVNQLHYQGMIPNNKQKIDKTKECITQAKKSIQEIKKAR